MKELVQTPLKKREPRFKLPTKKSKEAYPSVLSEMIFCIMNEKQIFQTLKDTTANKKDANGQFFIFEAL